VVLAYLDAVERRDLEAAESFVGDGDLDLIFPGGRRFSSVKGALLRSSGRYARISKKITGTDAWKSEQNLRVLVTGTLAGEWRDGSAFSDVRFIDWFELHDGKILRQHVWNDTGEKLVSDMKETQQ
jgi:hypothetical protein